MTHEYDIFKSDERYEMDQLSFAVTVEKVSDGLGFGYGTISAEAIGKQTGAEALARADKVIQSPAILVEVSADDDGQLIDDDGCGDGRRVGRIFQGFIERARSLNRAKVFGGGAAMAAADRIGAGRARAASLKETFLSGIGSLKNKMIDFGAHTAAHVQEGQSGCGAIDNAPAIVESVATYSHEITAVLTVLGVDTEGFGIVADNFAAYAEEIKDQPFRGREVMDEIMRDGKVVKELAGGHLESRIVLNFVRGYTVNQQAVREATNGEVDVFAVDVWRIEELAAKLHPGNEAEQKQAFLSMLAYTLATAAVLTKGDLPVYIVKIVSEEAAVPVVA